MRNDENSNDEQTTVVTTMTRSLASGPRCRARSQKRAASILGVRSSANSTKDAGSMVILCDFNHQRWWFNGIFIGNIWKYNVGT